MKITRITVHQVDLPLHEGRYSWSGGKSVDVFDCTVVAIETDEGLVGHGEITPLGPVYLPSYAAGARTAIAELAPALLGHDPREVDAIDRVMESTLKGHPYAKSALDMACWDLLGRSAGLPLVTLFGGRCGEDFTLYRAISKADPEAMAANLAEHRAAGYRRFQLKVGSDVATDIARIRACRAVLEDGDILVADANTGWHRHEAARIVRAVADLDVYIEQPCPSYDACLSIRRRTDHPFVLDESIDDLATLQRAIAEDAMDVVNIKIGKFGGLTRARQARDLCIRNGIAMTIEDAWGGDIVTAAIAHLAHSTPPDLLFTATDFNSYVTVSTAEHAPRRVDGRMAAPMMPGLGIEPRPEVLGPAVAEFRA